MLGEYGGHTSAVVLYSVPIAFVAPGIAPMLWLALFLGPVGRLMIRTSSRS